MQRLIRLWAIKMATLLLRCVAPMQSWGTSDAFQLRGTEHEPSKSGIIGLICAALGRGRSKAIDDVAALRMGVRIDRPGSLEVDFQTAQQVAKAGGGLDNQLSERYYLADAAFLVGLEGDKALLEMIQQALINPVWPLFLGRKSYLPSCPIAFSAGELGENPTRLALMEALQLPISLDCPLTSAKQTYKTALKEIKLVVECTAGDESALIRTDQPVSFAYGHRSCSRRYVKTVFAHIKSKEP